MASTNSSNPPNNHNTSQRQPIPILHPATSRRVPDRHTYEADAAASATIHESRSSSSTNSPAPNDHEESDFFLVANDSQSSLGIPNIQETQVTSDSGDVNFNIRDVIDICTPPVNRLPNEILMSIFNRLGLPSDQLHCMITCKRWARNIVDILWHRPACTNWSRHEAICQTLGIASPYFPYRDFVKRLNLASIADNVSDGSVIPLAMCNRIERLTLTNCKRLTDSGLISLVENSNFLLALDISGDDQITEATVFALAKNCYRLQGLNVAGCTKLSNESLIKLAESCRYIKRIKLNDCSQLTDDTVLAFARHCPNILEIDLHQCRLVTNRSVTELLHRDLSLRELRLSNCELIDDSAFLYVPAERIFEHLRILDLTSCTRLTDRAVQKIVDVAPRLRNLVLAKCRNITDAAIHSIARLGKNLHYVHLGHCGHITDDAVKRLVHFCNRIRYIDLGCCSNLTDDSVTRLATLPKLKRIGLVKCSNITDESVYALAKANQRNRQKKDADGTMIDNRFYIHSSLERVHLSYCTHLGIRSIIKLLDTCPRLTHLSLTGVPAFLGDDLNQFCRSPPVEFTLHQRDAFCVFSGEGVVRLRDHLNKSPAYSRYRDRDTVATVSMNRRPPLSTIDDTVIQYQPAYGVPNPEMGDDSERFDEESEILPGAPLHDLFGGNSVPATEDHALPQNIPVPDSAASTSTLVPAAVTFAPAAILHSAQILENSTQATLQPTQPVDIMNHDISVNISRGAPRRSASLAPISMSHHREDPQQGPSIATALLRSRLTNRSPAISGGLYESLGEGRASIDAGIASFYDEDVGTSNGVVQDPN